MSPPPGRSTGGAIALGASAVVACLMPVFLTGAMAVQLTTALGFGTVGLGMAVSLSRATPALISPFLGRLADDLGATRSIRLAAAVAVVASLGVVFTARSWATFVVWIMLSGCANQLAQPAANRLLANVVHSGRLGFAFGIKQSAPPAASMLAGLSVPLIALAFGWRWAFGAAAVLSGIVVLSARPASPRPPRPKGADRGPRPKLGDRRVLFGLAFAFGLGTAVSASTTTFYVDSAVPIGTPPQVAGYLLAAGSLGAILTRIVTGIACDRMLGGYLRLCAQLIASGCVGLLLLAVNTPVAMGFGVILALVGGWGFNGVFWYALVRAYPKSPGALTGAIAPGGLIGATLGPLGFAVVADRIGYPVMWVSVAVLAAAAAVAIWVVDKHLPTTQAADGE